MVARSSTALGLMVVLCGWTLILAQDKNSQPDVANPLYTWRAARTEFQKIGALLVKDEMEKASEQLGKLSAALPKPYGDMADRARALLKRNLAREAGRGLGPVVPKEAMERLGRHLSDLAEVASSLGDDGSAARLLEMSVNAEPDDNDTRRRWVHALLANLASVDQVKTALAPFENRAEAEHYQDQARQRQEKMGDPSYWVGDLQFGILSHLGHLDAIEARFIAFDEWRAKFYLRRADLLQRCGDIPGQLAWEEKLVADYPREEAVRSLILLRVKQAKEPAEFEAQLTRCRRAFPNKPGKCSEECAQVLLLRARQFIDDVDPPGAIAVLNRIQAEFPPSASQPALLTELASIYETAGAYRPAIEIYEKMVADALLPRAKPAPGAINSAQEYKRRYHTALAKTGLASCYEKLGQGERALYFYDLDLKLNRSDDEEVNISCGTGREVAESYAAATHARLMIAGGKGDEGWKFVERVMLGEGDDARFGFGEMWRDLFAGLIDYRLARGELGPLKEKMAAAREQAKVKRAKFVADFVRANPTIVPSNSGNDFVAQGILFAEEYLRQIDHARQVGHAGLWSELNHELVLPAQKSSYDQNWKERLPLRIFLKGDPNPTVAFLREKLRGSNRDRAFASILLGKLGRGVDPSILRVWMEEEFEKGDASEEGVAFAAAMLDAAPTKAAALIRARIDRIELEQYDFQASLHRILDDWKTNWQYPHL